MITPSPTAVTADDVDLAVAAALDTLAPAIDADWTVPAAGLTWSCWETAEHMADDLFAYAGQLAPRRLPLGEDVPFNYVAQRSGGPRNTVFADPDAGTAGLLQVLDASGGLLSAVVRGASPDARAFHVFGTADPEGFAAMGVVEVLVHTHDISTALDLPWTPPADLCDRVLHRLFPDTPTDTDRWTTLLHATGRADLPDLPRPTKWRWYADPR